MLELEALDLDDLCAALDDNSHEHSWWLDPRSGAVHLHAPDVDDTDWETSTRQDSCPSTP